MRETMKAIVLKSFGGPEVLDTVSEIPVPTPAADEVLVRVRTCGVCYLDTIVRSGVRPGTPIPHILGHEICGDVVELGDHVQGLAVGVRVATTYRGVCGHCYYCRNGTSVSCTNVRSPGVDRDGGYADFVSLQASSCVPVPPGVTDEAASIAGCVLGAVYRGVRVKARIQPGDTVLVTGAGGGAGLHAVQLAKLAGGYVLARTTSPQKELMIREAGADEILLGEDRDVIEQVRQITGGRGAGVVLDCVGKATASISLRSLARGGRLVFVGELGTEPMRVSIARMLYRETEIHGVASPDSGELWSLLELIARGQVRPIVTEQLPLERAADAHRMLAERANVGRIVLRGVTV